MSWPTTAVPVLPVSDLARATAWYQRLGFELIAEHPGYAIVELDGAELHLNEFDDLPGPQQTWSGAYLHVADADDLFARWTALGARAIAPPADQPYGLREFATEDLDGNLWRVGSPLVSPTIDPERTGPAGHDPSDAEPGTERGHGRPCSVAGHG